VALSISLGIISGCAIRPPRRADTDGENAHTDLPDAGTDTEREIDREEERDAD